MGAAVNYLFVFLLSALVALGELLARYRDNPMDSLKSSPAIFYIAFNGIVGVIALYILNSVTPDLLQYKACTDEDINTVCPSIQLLRVVAAAFGSLVVMRSAFARMSIGGQDIGIGPSALIEIFQKTADRGVDRTRAFRRIDELPKDLRKIPHDFASTTLAALCTELMQNLTAEEKLRISERIKLVTEASEQNEIRPLLVALILQQFVGKDVLSKAVAKIVTDYSDVLDRLTSERNRKAEQISPDLFPASQIELGASNGQPKLAVTPS